MAGCRIVNQGMLDAISEIQRIAGEYETVADEFISSLNNAISEMEGETKDALYELINSKVKTLYIRIYRLRSEVWPSCLKPTDKTLKTLINNWREA